LVLSLKRSGRKKKRERREKLFVGRGESLSWSEESLFLHPFFSLSLHSTFAFTASLSLLFSLPPIALSPPLSLSSPPSLPPSLSLPISEMIIKQHICTEGGEEGGEEGPRPTREGGRKGEREEQGNTHSST
jgi:hypothetical protein